MSNPTVCRTLGQRIIDAINGMLVSIMGLCRILWHSILAPIPLQAVQEDSPVLIVLFSGLGSPSFAWSPFLKTFRSRFPEEYKSFNIITTSNVRALREPMQRSLIEDTLPLIEQHIQKWKTNSRIVLVGHSLGAVDALWIACHIREKYRGTIPLSLHALFGAFGTSMATMMPSFGIHSTVQRSLHQRTGPFMTSLIERAQTLPSHPESEYTFVMAIDDATIRPPINSLVYGLPGRSKYFCVYGAGHMGAISCMELPTQNAIVRFFCSNQAPPRSKI